MNNIRYLVSWTWVPTVPTANIKKRKEEVMYLKYWDALNKLEELLQKEETNYYSSNENVQIFKMNLEELPQSILKP